MEMLPSSSDDGHIGRGEPVVYKDYASPEWGFEESGFSLNMGKLLRKYWLLLIVLTALGAAGGFASVVLSTPMYRARLLVEVQNINEAFLKNSVDATTYDSTEVSIQTQINILRSGPFLRRGADRLQSETVPLAPTGQDLF